MDVKKKKNTNIYIIIDHLKSHPDTWQHIALIAQKSNPKKIALKFGSIIRRIILESLTVRIGPIFEEYSLKCLH